MAVVCQVDVCRQKKGMCLHEKMLLGFGVLLIMGGGLYLAFM